MGLVNRVVPQDHVLTAAHELASQIAGANQKIVREMKKLYGQTTGSTLQEALRIEQETFRAFNRQTNPADLEQSREAVMERGRSQTARK
jgi:enoyl-CoA hydratase